MKRIYQTIITQQLEEHRQMAFLSGPRQAGKTTLAKNSLLSEQPSLYLNWDSQEDREMILSGIKNIYGQLEPDKLQANNIPPTIIFDEIHKYRDWKSMLKGYFDTLPSPCRIIVTGSAKLNIYRRGGDSMMGRYFLYHIHPLSVAEILGRNYTSSEIIAPKPLNNTQWDNLLQFGGFPEPYLQANPSFYQRWSNLRYEQLFREDLRDLSKIQEITRLELLAKLLSYQIGSTTKYSELAKKIRSTEPTVRKWVNILKNVYYCFSLSPWHKNITRSLIKEPKYYLWDWSTIEDEGAKIENFTASHLYKAVQFWTDIGLGKYELYYLRDKDKREVDFLITKNEKPWIMVEAKKSSKAKINPHLEHFNQQLQVPHVFQAAYDMPFIDKNCFSLKRPMIVPLITLLSQLV